MTDDVQTDIKKNVKKNRKKNGAAEKPEESVFLKKAAELQDQVQQLQDERDRLKDQLLRTAAEFDNFKRRSEKEFVNHLSWANEKLIVELLPVLDDLERSLGHARDDTSIQSILDGLQLIYKNLLSVLTKKGLAVMETRGTEFDPEQHQALMQVESADFASGTVTGEHLKGYKLNDKVIRHAQVLVAK